jgi:hypothetical protein
MRRGEYTRRGYQLIASMTDLPLESRVTGNAPGAAPVLGGEGALG